MKHNKIFASLLILVLAALFVTASCAAEKPDTTNWPKDLVLSGGPMGGPWYPFMVTFADLIMKEYPEISATAIEGGGVGNLRLVQKGVDSQIGMAHVPVFMKAIQNELDGMQPGEVFDKLVAGLVINSSYVTPIVRADSGINTFGEVASKRFSPGLVTSGHEPVVRDMLAEYGLSYDSIRENGGKVDFVNFSEMSSLMQDGHLDIGVFSGDMPHASAMELDAVFPVKILPFEDGVIDSLKKKYPYIVTEMVTPEKSYNGQKETVEVVLLIAVILYNKDVMPDDMIYHFTRLLLENHEELQKNNPNLFYLDWQDGMTGLTKEIMAPGAYRAFTEGPKK